MSRRIISVAVLAISLAMLAEMGCAPATAVVQTPESVCTALAACPEYSTALGAQKAIFQFACPIGLRLVQSRDTTCFSCIGSNPCDIQDCLSSCSTMINSVGEFSSLFGSLGVSTSTPHGFSATEAPDSSAGDALPAQ